jgi:hypothetical protein
MRPQDSTLSQRSSTSSGQWGPTCPCNPSDHGEEPRSRWACAEQAVRGSKLGYHRQGAHAGQHHVDAAIQQRGERRPRLQAGDGRQVGARLARGGWAQGGVWLGGCCMLAALAGPLGGVFKHYATESERCRSAACAGRAAGGKGRQHAASERGPPPARRAGQRGWRSPWPPRR